MAFDDATRMERISLGAQTAVGTTPLYWRLPKVGFAAALEVVAKGVASGTITSPSAFGFSSVLNNIKLAINGATDVFNMSGPGYHFGLRNFLSDYFDPVPQSNGRAVVTAAAFDVSFLLPIQVNQRDQAGLIALQNEATEAWLTITPETVAASIGVGAAAAYTLTVEPFLKYYTTPQNRADWPKYDVLHRVIEEARPITATGDHEHVVPRGNTYLQLLYLYGVAATGAADKWTAAKIRAAGSQFIEQITPDQANISYGENHTATRLLGVIPFDWLGSNGLGSYGGSRDAIHSDKITDLKGILTLSAQPDTLRIIRRELVQITGM